MYYKNIKKYVKNFFYSRIFFSIILIFIVGYIASILFTYIRHNNNLKTFSNYYTLLQRYEGIRKSTSFVPGKDLLDDVIKDKNALIFYSSFKKHYKLLEIAIKVNIGQYDEALMLLDSVIPSNKAISDDMLINLYQILRAIILACSKDINKQQIGINALKIMSESNKNADVALFYYGYFVRNTQSLKQADEIFNKFKQDPQFKSSPYASLVEKVRNLEI
jgi:hypothetical protein